jgi:hypothetical protein
MRHCRKLPVWFLGILVLGLNASSLVADTPGHPYTGMVQFIPVCMADFLAIKGIALFALALVSYLWWSAFKEKRERRRERVWLENRRRELREEAEAKAVPPHRM